MTVEKTAVTAVAGLMALAARTAPKAKGQDTILVRVLITSELKKLSRAMTTYGKTHENAGFFLRDAKNIAASDACVLVGVWGSRPSGSTAGHAGMPPVRHSQNPHTVQQQKSVPLPLPGPTAR